MNRESMTGYRGEGHSSLDVHRFTVGPFAENSYLVCSANESILVDPGFYTDSEFEDFSETLNKSGCRLIAVLLTHAHIDHLLGLHRVLIEKDVPVYLNQSDLTPWKQIQLQAAMFGLEIEPFQFTPEPLPGGEKFLMGELEFLSLYTPGHSPDHISLYFKEANFVISGDLLFREGVGRTDLYGGNFEQLRESIRTELYTLPDDTILYPGHGDVTTTGYEKVNNPFVKPLF